MNIKATVLTSPLVFCLALLCGAEASAQNSAADWFPIHVGDRWTYEHVHLDGTSGGVAHPEISRWETQETILDSATIAEGMLVFRRIQVLGSAPPPVPKQENGAWQPSFSLHSSTMPAASCSPLQNGFSLQAFSEWELSEWLDQQHCIQPAELQYFKSPGLTRVPVSKLHSHKVEKRLFIPQSFNRMNRSGAACRE
jgi:hypothetical protein